MTDEVPARRQTDEVLCGQKKKAGEFPALNQDTEFLEVKLLEIKLVNR